MTKQDDRKYGPKERTKNRNTSAKRHLARKEKFGDAKVGATSPSPRPAYTPRAASTYAPKPSAYKTRMASSGARPTTAYVKKTYTPSTGSPVKRPYVKREGGVARTYTPRVGNSATTPASAGSAGYVKKPYVQGAFGKGPRATAYTPRTGAYTPLASSGIKKSTSWSKSKMEKSSGIKKAYKPVFKSVVPNKPRTASASWGEVASWYDKHLNEADTYHEKVILPNLLRLVESEKSDRILDLACGQGFFTRSLAKTGAHVEGIDIAPELIAIAKTESPLIPYHIGSATNLSMLKELSFNKAVISLAIQNIEKTEAVLKEVERVLVDGGALHIVMNHPAFRIPKESAWDYDDKQKVQFRRVNQYLSNSKTEIEMHPGFSDAPKTISFHRPLQFYFKALSKMGFAVVRLEEWISHKASDSGPRAEAENNARKEIPLFMYLKAVKLPT